MEHESVQSKTSKDGRKPAAHDIADQQQTPAIHRILQLQRTIGNRATTRLIQAKCEVSDPGRPYSQKIDEVVQRLMTMPTSDQQPMRQDTPEEEKKKKEQTVQRKPFAGSITSLPQQEMIPEVGEDVLAHADEAVSAVSSSTGQPLPSNNPKGMSVQRASTCLQCQTKASDDDEDKKHLPAELAQQQEFEETARDEKSYEPMAARASIRTGGSSPVPYVDGRR